METNINLPLSTFLTFGRHPFSITACEGPFKGIYIFLSLSTQKPGNYIEIGHEGQNSDP